MALIDRPDAPRAISTGSSCEFPAILGTDTKLLQIPDFGWFMVLEHAEHESDDEEHVLWRKQPQTMMRNTF